MDRKVGVGSASFRGGPESGGKVIWIVSIHLLIGSFSNFFSGVLDNQLILIKLTSCTLELTE